MFLLAYRIKATLESDLERYRKSYEVMGGESNRRLFHYFVGEMRKLRGFGGRAPEVQVGLILTFLIEQKGERKQ